MAVAPGIFIPGVMPVTPATGGILDRITPTEENDPHVRRGITYESEYAGTGGAIEPGDDPCGPTAEKLADGFNFVEGVPFGIYHGVECFIADDVAERAGRAERSFTLMESHHVEEKLWPILADKAVDITPAGGPVKPKLALGLLLEYAGSNYPGVPMLHFGRILAPVLVSEKLVEEGESDAAAVGGAQYINGTGYTSRIGPDGVDAGPGAVWVYISGQVRLWRTPFVTNEAYYAPKNKHLAITEREYVATVETFVAGIRVSLE